MDAKEPAKGEYSSEFLMYSYKVTPCGRKYPHDWASCPCGHKGERAARRDLRVHPYVAIACTYAKQKLPCPSGDACPFAHSLFEYWLHPARYRTEVCQYGAQCERPVCFFAHNLEELRSLEESLPPAELCWSSGAITNRGGARATRSNKEQKQMAAAAAAAAPGAGAPAPAGAAATAAASVQQQQRLQRAASAQLPPVGPGLAGAAHSSLMQSAFARAASLGGALPDSILDPALLPPMLSAPLSAPLHAPLNVPLLGARDAWAAGLDSGGSAAAEPWSALDRTASAPLHSPSNASSHSSGPNSVDWKTWGGAGGLFETPTDGVGSPSISPTSVLGAGLPPPALTSMGQMGQLSRAHTMPLGGLDGLLGGNQGSHEQHQQGQHMLPGLRSAFSGFDVGQLGGATCVVSANVPGAMGGKAALYRQYVAQQQAAGDLMRGASLDSGMAAGGGCNSSQAQQLAHLITQMPESMVDSLVSLLQAVQLQQVA